MKFRDDRQRKAVFARLNKFSGSPAETLGAIGERLARSVVRTFPENQTAGVIGLYPDRPSDAPPVSSMVECLVLDAYPDGKPIDSYGEAFAEGKALEWADASDGKIDGKIGEKKIGGVLI